MPLDKRHILLIGSWFFFDHRIIDAQTIVLVDIGEKQPKHSRESLEEALKFYNKEPLPIYINPQKSLADERLIKPDSKTFSVDSDDVNIASQRSRTVPEPKARSPDGLVFFYFPK